MATETIIAMLAGSHADKMEDNASLRSFRQRPLCVIIWRAVAASPRKGQMTQQRVRSSHLLISRTLLRRRSGRRVPSRASPAEIWPCQAASCHPGLGRHRPWSRKIFVDVTFCGIQSPYRLGRPYPWYGMVDALQTPPPLRRRGRRRFWW
ncbi:hypothetical protein BDW67DRAFT_87602 [Aspergillus spinulosporus]